MDVKKLSEDEVKKRLNKLIYVNDCSDECQKCGLPQLLHIGACTWINRTDEKEEFQVLKDFSKKMKPLVIWMKRERDSVKQEMT